MDRRLRPDPRLRHGVGRRNLVIASAAVRLKALRETATQPAAAETVCTATSLVTAPAPVLGAEV